MSFTEPFAELPDALVRDLLQQAPLVAEGVSCNLQALQAAAQPLRREAERRNWIRRRADLDVPREPSVVGIDGSYYLHGLSAVDLCAAAAVAVEGTSREAVRHWQEPYHRIWVAAHSAIRKVFPTTNCDSFRSWLLVLSLPWPFPGNPSSSQPLLTQQLFVEPTIFSFYDLFFQIRRIHGGAVS
jgi:hypothetical protein